MHNGASGVFYKPSALPEYYNTYRIPEGWEVRDISEYDSGDASGFVRVSYSGQQPEGIAWSIDDGGSWNTEFNQPV